MHCMIDDVLFCSKEGLSKHTMVTNLHFVLPTNLLVYTPTHAVRPKPESLAELLHKFTLFHACALVCCGIWIDFRMSAVGEKKSCEKKRILRTFLFCLCLLMIILVGTRRSFHKLKATFNKSKNLISSNVISLKLQKIADGSKDLPVTVKTPALTTTLATPEWNTATGFVMVSHYSDQMTGASLNLLALQCWASKLHGHVRVVEPFLVKGSKFGFDLPWMSSAIQQQNISDYVPRVRLRDMLDIEGWENQTTKYGLAPIISWTDFLKEAPRNLILVNSECSRQSDYDGCKNSFLKPAFRFADQHNLTVVREVCIKRILYSARQFEDLVYGSHYPSHSVVLFNYWGGIHSRRSKAYRIGISDMEDCDRLRYSSFLFQSSKTVQKDSQRYIERYMPLAKNNGYISVMFRSERFGLSHGFQDINNSEQKLLTLTDCVRSITEYVDKLKALYNIQSVFLAMDCRRQGSMAFRRLTGPAYMSKDLVDRVTLTLYQNLHGNSSSLNDWDESFDRIASFKTAGYLAQLQKSLAANGTCLLTAGGGNFQLSAVRLYNETHKSSNAHCAFQVPGCM